MGESRAIAVTTLGGGAGMLVGAVTASAMGATITDPRLFLGVPVHWGLPGALVAVGFLLGPWIALRTAGFDVAEVTVALGALWVCLLLMSVGPFLAAVGPGWFPFPLALTALAIARAIAGPFAPFITASRDVAESISA